MAEQKATKKRKIYILNPQKLYEVLERFQAAENSKPHFDEIFEAVGIPRKTAFENLAKIREAKKNNNN